MILGLLLCVTFIISDKVVSLLLQIFVLSIWKMVQKLKNLISKLKFKIIEVY